MSAERTETWRILFEGFSCAGADRKSDEDISMSKKPLEGKNNKNIAAKKDDTDIIRVQFKKLEFPPQYNEKKMWVSSPIQKKNCDHLKKLIAHDPQNIHFANNSAPEAIQHVAALGLLESIIVGAKFNGTSNSNSKNDKTTLDNMQTGGNVRTVGKGPAVIICVT